MEEVAVKYVGLFGAKIHGNERGEERERERPHFSIYPLVRGGHELFLNLLCFHDFAALSLPIIC